MKIATTLLAAAMLLMTACDQTKEAPSHGTLVLPLTTTGLAGATYTLSNANFTIAGPESATITNPTGSAASETLLAGAYTITLASGWSITTDQGGQQVVVDATLVSDATQSFTITPDAITTVDYKFVAGMTNEGTAQIGFSVDQGYMVTALFTVTNNPDTATSTDFFDGIENVPLVMTWTFPIAATSKIEAYSDEYWTTVEFDPIAVDFSGSTDAALDTLKSKLHGDSADITYKHNEFYDMKQVMGARLWNRISDPSASTYYVIEWYSDELLDYAVDESFYANVEPFTFTDATVYLSIHDMATEAILEQATATKATVIFQ
jgi:hypothetical protein